MPSAFSMMISIVNVLFAAAGLIMTVYGVCYFKSGLIAKTLKRGMLVGTLLLVHFLPTALATNGLVPFTGIEDVTGLLFMASLVYLTYGFINDFKNLDKLKPL